MSLIPRMTQRKELRLGREHSSYVEGKRDVAPAPEQQPLASSGKREQNIAQRPWDRGRG